MAPVQDSEIENIEPSCILAMDDDMLIRQMLCELLEDAGYDVLEAADGQEGLAILEAEPAEIDLIITDLMMPLTSGRQVLAHLKKSRKFRHIPVIVISGMGDMDSVVDCIEQGADDYLAKPFNLTLLKTRVGACIDRKKWRDREKEYHKKIEDYNLRLEERVRQQIREIYSAQQATILALSQLAEFRDPDTGAHLGRIRAYCKLLATELAKHQKYSKIIDRNFIEAIYGASPLHDIGKVGIPDHILLKPGKLTEDEFATMKTHTLIGAETLKAVDKEHPGNLFVRMGIEIAATHHERWNGTGYPHELKGEEIPLAGRIVALCDVYDALTSERCYKGAFDFATSESIIIKENGGHFDPDIVAAFEGVKDDFASLRTRLRDT